MSYGIDKHAMAGNRYPPPAQPAPCSEKARHNTAIRFPIDVHDRLQRAAEERDVSMNWLVVRAVRDFLDRLIPADEIVLTTDAKERL